MSGESKAVFLSYASEDSDAAARIADALRAAGVEVWFDKSELRGGDAWDHKIRQQIRACTLFVPIVSRNTEARLEGYFRREWRLAADRMLDIDEGKPFLVPVAIDATSERSAHVPDVLRSVHWSRLPGGEASSAFVNRICTLLDGTAMTPADGQPLSQKATSASEPHRNARGRRLGPAVGMAALAVLAAAGWFAWRNAALNAPAASPTASDRSIAVLPFADLSENHDQEYFGDGMAEEILNLLVKIPGLKVISRSSSFQFRGNGNELRKVGEALGSSYIVEGSVRRSGDNMRVTAELVNARDGTHRWSDVYDRNVRDALAVQGEIAANIARALQIEMGALPIRTAPKSQEAYEFFLRGVHATDRYDLQGFGESIENFRRALEIDPAFEPAAEWLAFSLYFLADYGFVAPKKGFADARAAALRALALDPESSLAHAVLGRIDVDTWDWAAAGRELDAATRLAPSNWRVTYGRAQLCIALGQWNEAARLSDAVVASDPLGAAPYVLRLWSYVRLGRLAEAEQAGRRVLEISPTYSWGHYFLGMVLWTEGKFGEALAEMKLEPVPEGRDSGLVVVYQALHRRKDAEAAMESLRHDPYWPMGFVYGYVALGQPDKAFEWLATAHEGLDADLWYMKGHPFLKALEADPRYEAFLRKMNLPQ